MAESEQQSANGTTGATPSKASLATGSLEGESKALGKALIRAFLARAIRMWERVDQFSTWMTGGAAAAIALLVGNLSMLRTTLGPWHVRVTLWILAASVFAGLAEKYFAISVGMSAAFAEAGETAMQEHTETIERLKDPVSGLSSDQIVKQFLVPFLSTVVLEFKSALPTPFRSLLKDALSKLVKSDENPSAKAYRAMMWQNVLVYVQLWLLGIAVVVATTSV